MNQTPRNPASHSLQWQEPDFYDETSLNKEMERVFDTCHGCRRCVNLCHAFPTLFDLIDESDSGEVDGVAVSDYKQVVDQCYMCDMCYQIKCPYIPPHEWKIDFPYLMLRAKANAYKKKKPKKIRTKVRDSVLSSPDFIAQFVVHPGVNKVFNRAMGNKAVRKLVRSILGISEDAWIPNYLSSCASKCAGKESIQPTEAVANQNTSGKVALFVGCYGDYNDSKTVEDIMAVYRHNGIVCEPLQGMKCCGMPKFELGDLQKVYQLNKHNSEKIRPYIEKGYNIVGMVPSCTLMMRREVVAIFPDKPEVSAACAHVFDPAEYLMLRHQSGHLNTNFKKSLRKISYHAACHQRVQNIGPKTRDLLSLIPDTTVDVIERCSGHDGTYAMRDEHHEIAVKLARPAARKLIASEADFFTSDCMLAGHHIAHVADTDLIAKHPISLLREAYGI